MDYNKFFRRKAEVVAKDLLGRILIRKTDKGITGGQISETGAYEGGKQTPSRKGMNYIPGAIFIMSRRRFHLFNISSEKWDKPSCVELRAITLHDKVIVGPGKISKYFDIGPELDGLFLGNELQITGERVSMSKIVKSSSSIDNCIGYFSIKK